MYIISVREISSKFDHLIAFADILLICAEFNWVLYNYLYVLKKPIVCHEILKRGKLNNFHGFPESCATWKQPSRADCFKHITSRWAHAYKKAEDTLLLHHTCSLCPVTWMIEYWLQHDWNWIFWLTNKGLICRRCSSKDLWGQGVLEPSHFWR